MKVNDLFTQHGSIFRLLGVSGNKALIINCLEKKMPYWVNMETIQDSELTTQEHLLEKLNVDLPTYDSLTQEKRKTIHEKYGSISLVLPFISQEPERNSSIEICSQKFGLSKGTIRNRLCSYLIFQDIRIFLSTQKKTNNELSNDEKNFRWALNKYYYNSIKMSLKETYRRMIRDKYCDESGKVLSIKPSFRQFSYYYYKTVSQENLIISREGKGNFLRNHRVMLGNGIRDFCPTIVLLFTLFTTLCCTLFTTIFEIIPNATSHYSSPIMQIKYRYQKSKHII